MAAKSPANGSSSSEKNDRDTSNVSIQYTIDQKLTWSTLREDPKFAELVNYLIKTKGWTPR